MFFGGLNGDGFYGEEYDNGYGDYSDEYPTKRVRSQPNPLYYHQKIMFSLLDETEKAYLIHVENITMWIPKSWCRGMNKDKTSCYVWIKGYNKNLKRSVEIMEGYK